MDYEFTINLKHPGLPDELWLKIFSLACIDGGRTGRSIALSCRRFNDISASVRLQSVELRSDNALAMMRDLLATLPASNRQVRHLFICPNLPKGTTVTASHANTQGLPLRSSDYKDPSVDSSRSHTDRRHEDKARLDNVRLILDATATTLETLAVYAQGWKSNVHHAKGTLFFPVLRDLIISRAYYRNALEGDQSRSTRPVLPALKRLHLYQAESRVNAALLRTIAEMAPGLVKLRISELEQTPQLPGLIADLCGYAYTSPHNERRPLPRDEQCFNRIESIIITATETVNVGQCGTGRITQGQMVKGFKQLQTISQDSEGPRITFLPEKKDYGDELRGDWLDVIQGRCGCW